MIGHYRKWFILLFISGVIYARPNEIRGIQFAERENDYSVIIQCDNNLIKYDQYIRESPFRLVIELYNTISKLSTDHHILELDPLYGFKISEKSGEFPMCELILEFDEIPKYSVYSEGETIRIRWDKIIQKTTPTPPVATEKAGKPVFILHGIVWKEGAPTILMNDDVYHQGDVVNGYEVYEIKKNSVILKKGYDRVVLNIEE